MRDGFSAFVDGAEPQLRRALVARFGVELGREAAVDALVYGWQHWERVRGMENPVGYLYRVGASQVRGRRPIAPTLVAVDDRREPWVEPRLEAGLDALTDNQRMAVVLRHSFEWTYDEIAELLEVSVSTVRNHLARGMAKLREELEVSADDRS